jgi:tetratricopeptide (TPR) repeat protein
MTGFQFWLLWIIGAMLMLTVISMRPMVLRLLILNRRHHRQRLALEVFYLALSIMGIAVGIRHLLRAAPVLLASPVHPFLIAVAILLLGGAVILFIRDVPKLLALLLARRASALLRTARYSEALAIYNRLLKPYRTLPGAWIGKGIALQGLDRADEALAAYAHIPMLYPNYAYAWALKSGSLFSQRHYAEALDASYHATMLAPNDMPGWAYKGRISNQLGRHNDALDACDYALRPDSTQASDAIRGTAWSARAAALNALGRHEAALAAADEAVKFSPQPVRARLAQAIAPRHMQRNDEAQAAAEQGLATAERFLTRRPTNLNVWGARADLLYFLGREAEARAAEEHVESAHMPLPKHALASLTRFQLLQAL